MTKKRPRKHLSLKQKLDIINELKHGTKTQNEIADDNPENREKVTAAVKLVLDIARRRGFKMGACRH
jgi:hypothetical protein